MPLLAPNSASTFSAAGSIPFSAGKPIWIGFQTLTASGSCTFYQTTTCTSGCELISISLSPMQQVLFGPFVSALGIYAAGVNGGCALAMIRR